MGPRIFVSSTSRDTAQYRQAVLGTIDSAELEAVAMEDWSTAHVGPVTASLEKLEKESDHYLGLFGFYRGTEVDSAGEMISITEHEYRHACRVFSRTRIAVYAPRIPSEAEKDLFRRAEELEEGTGASRDQVELRLIRQRAFLEAVHRNGTVVPFKDNRELVSKTADQMQIWKAGGSWIGEGEPVRRTKGSRRLSRPLRQIGLRQQILAFEGLDQSPASLCIVAHGPASHGQERLTAAILDHFRDIGGVDVRELGLSLTESEVDTVVHTLSDDACSGVDDFVAWLEGRLAGQSVVLSVERAHRYRRDGTRVGAVGLIEDFVAPVVVGLSARRPAPEHDVRVVLSSALPIEDEDLPPSFAEVIRVLPRLGPVTVDELMAALPAGMTRVRRADLAAAILAETTEPDRVLAELERSPEIGTG